MQKLSFDKLDINAKGKLVLMDQGKFLSSRKYYNQTLVLYDMGDFFAEVWYEPESNKIHKIDSIEPGDKKIDRYIDSETKPNN
jgi:hypothetical protein